MGLRPKGRVRWTTLDQAHRRVMRMGFCFIGMEEGKTCQELPIILRLTLSKSAFTFSKFASHPKIKNCSK